MASKRTRIRAAKRRVLTGLIPELERTRSMSDPDDILGIDALLSEFRRRAEIADPPVPPGQQCLPGMGVFTITFNPAEGPAS